MSKCRLWVGKRNFGDVIKLNIVGGQRSFDVGKSRNFFRVGVQTFFIWKKLSRPFFVEMKSGFEEKTFDLIDPPRVDFSNFKNCISINISESKSGRMMWQQLLSEFNACFVYSAVGTTWDKDFRICLVLSSLKMDLIYEKNSEFYIPEEQVSLKSCRLSGTHRYWHSRVNKTEWKIHEWTHPLTSIAFLWKKGITFLAFPDSWPERRVDTSGPSFSNRWWTSRIAVTGPERLLMNCPLSSRSRYVLLSCLLQRTNPRHLLMTCLFHWWRCCIAWITRFTRCDYGAIQRRKSFVRIGTWTRSSDSSTTTWAESAWRGWTRWGRRVRGVRSQWMQKAQSFMCQSVRLVYDVKCVHK